VSKVTVDFNKTAGKVKPMHAVNNGPSGSKVRECMYNHDYFKEAGIPYARNHDAAFYTGYGGDGTVDVHRIFRNFDADVNDPASYEFEWTDKYIEDTESVGTKTFYRLGATIEHQRKEGTYPPKDYLKWAQICEHIIMHYTEGWADGFYYDIEYWEIWNEPDCRAGADGPSSTWQGTDEEFAEFFTVAFKYLKGRFPHLKIGGPAIAWIWSPWMLPGIIETIKKENLKLDFFSFHRYTRTPQEFLPDIEEAQRLMKECGNEDAELILNEWNYIKGWRGEQFEYSIRSIQNHKGAAFTAGVMAVCQYTPLHMLMYYEARPCAFNGMFDAFNKPLKGYYPFKNFNELYKMGTCVEINSDDFDILPVAAKGDDGKTAVMITYYTDEEATASTKEVKLDFVNGSDKYDFYLIDEEHTNDFIGTIKKDTSLVMKPNSVAFLISK